MDTKRVLNLLLPVLLLAFMQSCDIQKRLYRKGFFVAHRSVPVSIEKKKSFQPVADEKEASSFNELSVIKSAPAKNYSSARVVSASGSNVVRPCKVKQGKTGNQHKPTESHQKTASIGPEEIDFAKEKEIRNQSILALAFGVAGYFFSAVSALIPYVGLLGIVFAALAIVFGSIARKKIKSYPLPVKGSAMATVGLVLGIVYFAILLLAVLLIFVLLANF